MIYRRAGQELDAAHDVGNGCREHPDPPFSSVRQNLDAPSSNVNCVIKKTIPNPLMTPEGP